VAAGDDDAACDGYAGRGSRVVAAVGKGVASIFLLVEKGSSNDTRTAAAAADTFTLAVTCGIATPQPTPLPTPLPTPVPSFEFVTALTLNATLRLEFADPSDFDGLRGDAAAAFASAFAHALAYTRADAVTVRGVAAAGLPCRRVQPTPAPSPRPTAQPSGTPQPRAWPVPPPSPTPTVSLGPSLGPSSTPTSAPTQSPAPSLSSRPSSVAGARRALLATTAATSIACGGTVSGTNAGMASYVGSASGDAIYQFTTTEPVRLLASFVLSL